MQVLVRDPVDCASLHGLATRVRFGLTIGALLKAGSAVEWAWGNDWAIARALPNPSFYVFIASTTDDNAAAVHACCDAIAAIARAEGSQSVRFAAVDELVQPAIVAAMTQRLFAVAYCGGWDAYVNTDDTTRTTPHNEHVTELQQDDAPYIDSEWEHRSETSLAVIRECIAHRPSGGYRVDGVGLVTWAVTRVDGSIGIVGCRETHRRKGLASQVVAHVLARATGPVYVCIDAANEASIRLHEKLGFRKAGVKLYWFRVERQPESE